MINPSKQIEMKKKIIGIISSVSVVIAFYILWKLEVPMWAIIYSVLVTNILNFTDGVFRN